MVHLTFLCLSSPPPNWRLTWYTVSRNVATRVLSQIGLALKAPTEQIWLLAVIPDSRERREMVKQERKLSTVATLERNRRTSVFSLISRIRTIVSVLQRKTIREGTRSVNSQASPSNCHLFDHYLRSGSVGPCWNQGNCYCFKGGSLVSIMK